MSGSQVAGPGSAGMRCGGRSLAGNPEWPSAFQAWFAEIEPRLRGILRFCGADADLVDYAVQETMTRVYQRKTQLEFRAKDAFRAYCTVVARNVLYARRRKAASKRETSLPDGLPARDGPTPEWQLMFRTCWEELPAVQQQVLTLWMDDATIAATAEALGLKAKTASRLREVAFAGFRRILLEHGFDPTDWDFHIGRFFRVARRRQAEATRQSAQQAKTEAGQ